MKRMIDNKDYDLLKDNVKDINEELELKDTNYIISNVVVEDNKVLGSQIKDVENDITYNLPLGSQVEANPTLEGTESDLEGIKIDGTKYKVGGGSQLYQHNIYINNDGLELTFKIKNSSNTKFNETSLKAYLWDNYFRANSDYPYIYEASGYRYTNSGGTPKTQIFAGIYNDTGARLAVKGRDISNNAFDNYIISSANNIYDKVIPL